jgi:hypothetical protein
MNRWATIEGNMRFDLGREWLPGKARMMYLMCNPSTADAHADDNTIRRCIRFAAEHHCGSIEVVNLWPFRATDPSNLWRALDEGKISQSVAQRNIDFVCRAAQRATYRVMAFGIEPVRRNEVYVRDMVELVGHAGPLYALGVNDAGWPLHPLARGKLAITNGTQVQPWAMPGAA